MTDQYDAIVRCKHEEEAAICPWCEIDRLKAALREVEATNTEHCEDCKMNVGYAKRALATTSDPGPEHGK